MEKHNKKKTTKTLIIFSAYSLFDSNVPIHFLIQMLPPTAKLPPQIYASTGQQFLFSIFLCPDSSTDTEIIFLAFFLYIFCIFWESKHKPRQKHVIKKLLLLCVLNGGITWVWEGVPCFCFDIQYFSPSSTATKVLKYYYFYFLIITIQKISFVFIFYLRFLCECVGFYFIVAWIFFFCSVSSRFVARQILWIVWIAWRITNKVRRSFSNESFFLICRCVQFFFFFHLIS